MNRATAIESLVSTLGNKCASAITAQNRDISRGGGGNYKCRVESVECKVKGCPDFTTPSIPHNQFTVHNAACAASSVAAPFAFYAFVEYRQNVGWQWQASLHPYPGFSGIRVNNGSSC